MRRRQRWTGILCVRATAAAALGMALALAPGAAHGGVSTTTVSADVAGRYGPAGLWLSAGVARRWPQEDGASALARGRYAQVGLSAGVSPALAQGTVAAEWVPVAPLQLRLQYDLQGYFGANGVLLELPSEEARFGDAALDALGGREVAGVGHRVMFGPVLRARLGALLLRNQTDLCWYALSSRPGWYHEVEYDTLLARQDWLVDNSTALFAELLGRTGTSLLLGPMYEVTRSGAAAIVRQRVGAALYLVPAGRRLGLDRVRVYALAGVNLADRNREGEPFAALGVGGDLELGAARGR